MRKTLPWRWDGSLIECWVNRCWVWPFVVVQLWCAAGVNLSGGKTRDGGSIVGASVFYKDMSGGESGPIGPRKTRGSQSSLERLEQELKVRSPKNHTQNVCHEEGNACKTSGFFFSMHCPILRFCSCNMSSFRPWPTKPVLSVNFSKLRFIDQAE